MVERLEDDGSEDDGSEDYDRAVENPGPHVRAALRDIARRLGHEGPLEGHLRLVEDLRLDSLGLLTLAVEVEDRFRVCLSAEDEAAIRTIGDLERLLLARLPGDGGTTAASD
jgi:acyl carrier protein